MSSPIQDAASIIYRSQPDWRGYPPISRDDAHSIAHALSDAGLIVREEAE